MRRFYVAPVLHRGAISLSGRTQLRTRLIAARQSVGVVRLYSRMCTAVTASPSTHTVSSHVHFGILLVQLCSVVRYTVTLLQNESACTVYSTSIFNDFKLTALATRRTRPQPHAVARWPFRVRLHRARATRLL
jgi:hypothetical protein